MRRITKQRSDSAEDPHGQSESAGLESGIVK